MSMTQPQAYHDKAIYHNSQGRPIVNQEELQISTVTESLYRTTFSRALYKYDLYGRMARWKPLLKKGVFVVFHKPPRRHISKTGLCSDEAITDDFEQNAKCYKCRKPKTTQHDGYSYMLWGCVSSLCTGNQVRIDGKMDG